MDLFIYQWLVEDENEGIIIRGFGLNKKNENVSIPVKNFKPWISLEVKNQTLNKINVKSELKRYVRDDFILDDFKYKSKLYFDHGDKKFKVFPLYFYTIKSRKMNYYMLFQT